MLPALLLLVTAVVGNTLQTSQPACLHFFLYQQEHFLISSQAGQIEWKPKQLAHEPRGGDGLSHEPRRVRQDVAALPCGGAADLSDGEEVRRRQAFPTCNLEQVTLESPNFPRRYPNRANCRWTLTVPAGDEVTVWCEKFNIRKGDSLQVTYGGLEGCVRFCLFISCSYERFSHASL